ncbi:hypothetical protein Are01nite_61620 [Actinoplanes regularis]|nr:hypothetical protein Are01nite_61620 [Actinoplanes regularis]
MALETVDTALDGVALSIDGWIEGRQAAALGASRFAVGILVALAGNTCPDTARPQVGAVAFRRVGLVREDKIGTGTRCSATEPRDTDLAQDRDELRAVAALPGGDDQRQDLLTLLARQMRLGGQAAALSDPRATAGFRSRP